MGELMSRSKLSRRSFISTAAAGAAAISAAAKAGPTQPSEKPPRKFYNVLSLGRLGHHATFPDSVSLAVKHGFEGVDPDLAFFSGLSDGELSGTLEDLKSKNLNLGDAGLPVEFRKDEATFSDDLKKLPAAAKVLQGAGVARVSTYIMPCDNDLTYLQNFRQHAARLRECARVLADHGQILGLEYVGPRTLWRSMRHPFIHTMSETKELMVAIGTDNLAIQLDSFHWYNAEESAADIESLRNRDVATVDLNDAPKGIDRDHLMDNSRELPAATGVIPAKEFLGALAAIGYDGPIHAEPFNKAVREMPIDGACAASAAAMKKAFALAGLQ
jgi:sugar phosphate isomerase/epimerase